MTSRLDNFTDAAFAFAVSLLVIGGARAPETFDALVGSLGDIPAFAFGFAVMAMFWLGHVRWRRLRGERGIWLILALTGIASILVSLTRYGIWAAMLYATLPLTIGLFAWRHDWTGERRAAAA